jgi:choline dehydrogenase-like flavoprotein
MKRAIVVGSGAAGATAALALQGAFQVTVLEAGREFRPLRPKLETVEKIKRVGWLFDHRQIGIVYPPMRTAKTRDGMVLVWGRATGGTTPMTAGNALRMDQDLRALGVDLDAEFDELGREIPISDAHRARWRESTRRLHETFEGLGLDPRPMPKMADGARCTSCGRCILGCPTGAKWDARRFLAEAEKHGAHIVTGAKAERLAGPSDRATGVIARIGLRRHLIPAELIILAAGGFGTPAILGRSGIACEDRLFVDPVLCVAAPWPGALQDREVPMPFAASLDGFILSPYFDYLSYYFDRRWKSGPGDIVSLMIKFADSSAGTVRGRRIRKPLTPADKERLSGAVRLAEDVLARAGMPRARLFQGILNAGHPGGMLPLTAATASTLQDRRLPGNVYVADASLFPGSLGNPPSLTIMALARKVSRAAAARWA